MFTYTRPYANTRNLLLALVCLRALQLPAVAWAIGYVIAGPIANGDAGQAVFAIGGFVVLVLLTEVCFMARMRLAMNLGEAVVFDMRRQIFEHLIRQPMSFFDRMPLGRLISRLTSDVDVVRIGIQDVVFVSTVQFGSMLVAAALMLYYDWFLFLLVCTMVPLLWLVIRYFRVRLRQAYRDVQETYSRLTSSLAESVNGIRVIQGFARQESNNQRFSDLIGVHSENNMAVERYSAVFLPLLEINGQLFLSLLVVVGGYQALSGGLELTSLIQFLFLSNLFFGPVPVLGAQYNQARTAMAGAERVFALLDEQPEWAQPESGVTLQQPAGCVEFRNVGLQYVAGRSALDEVTFVAAPGEALALVGRTGSGKSSIARLVARLYRATSGQVLIDGVDVRLLSANSFHQAVGSVPQDNYLFAGSVRENIRFGRPGASDAEVERVVKNLGISDIVEALPHGFETDVGEKGAALSLGQRQLLCFARALLADPRVLILDEATSCVDPVTEARLQTALKALLRGRTSLVIAHRLSTIRHADKVLVIDAGRIVESGRHQELLEKGGHYAALYQKFARGLLVVPEAGGPDVITSDGVS
jgi:ATP-binding cassette subfamily B protein